MFNSRIGLGPVFAYEWITSSRRWQTFAVRSCFVSSLLGALILVRISNTAPSGTTLRELAQMAELFFLAVSGTQLALVLLVAPATTAGAICLDRARGTLSHMLLTDLSDAEIVLGKLAARLIPVLGLLVCMLPVMELLSLLGGVDPTALLGGFAVALAVAVFGCSLAMCFSLSVRKTHESLMGTYAVWALWLLAGPMIDMVASKTGWAWVSPGRTTNPFFLALAPYTLPGSVSPADYVWFLGISLALSVVLAGVTVLRLRSVALREKVVKPPRRLAANQIPDSLRWFFGKFPRLCPSLDSNPVLWREWHHNRPSRWSMVVALLFALVSAGSSMIVVAWPGGPACAWVNGFQVSIGLLFVSVAAATSLGEERVRGSLDLLLSTPLFARQIVLGKWLGAYRMVPPLAIFPAFVIGGCALKGNWNYCWVLLLMIIYVLSAGAAITSLGVAMATFFSRLGRAVALTVTVYVFVTAGWLMIMTVSAGGFPQHELQMASPFFWAGSLTLDVANGGYHVAFGAAIFWTIAAAWVGVELLGFTIRHFERRLGRIEAPDSRLALRTRQLRVWTKVYLALAMVAGIISLDREWAPPAIAFQFIFGLLLLAWTAAVSSREFQETTGGIDVFTALYRRSPAILAWRSVAYRLTLRVVIPSLLVLLFHARARYFGVHVLVHTIYALSVGAAFLSLGVLSSTSRHGKGWTIGLVTVSWVLVNAGWLFLGGAFGGESSWAGRALVMGSPFALVASLAAQVIQPQGSEDFAVRLALFWAIVYAVAARGLLQRARLQSRGDDGVMIPPGAHAQLTTQN